MNEEQIQALVQQLVEQLSDSRHDHAHNDCGCKNENINYNNEVSTINDNGGFHHVLEDGELKWRKMRLNLKMQLRHSIYLFSE